MNYLLNKINILFYPDKQVEMNLKKNKIMRQRII